MTIGSGIAVAAVILGGAWIVVFLLMFALLKHDGWR